MKNIVIFIVMMSSCLAITAQESKIKKESFFVNGVWGMCKERIENAALRTKGVKTASWDKVSKQLTVQFNSQKTDVEAIKSAVAEKGHESDTHKSNQEAYDKLPNCCRYNHGGKCSD